MPVPHLEGDDREAQNQKPSEDRLGLVETKLARDSGRADCKRERSEDLIQRDEVIVSGEDHGREGPDLPTGRIAVVAKVDDRVQVGDAVVLPPELCPDEMMSQLVVLHLRNPGAHRDAVREGQRDGEPKHQQKRIHAADPDRCLPRNSASRPAGDPQRRRTNDHRSDRQRRGGDAMKERQCEDNEQ